MYRDFLAQFMRPEPPTSSASVKSSLPEAACGLPLDAAKDGVVLLVLCWFGWGAVSGWGVGLQEPCLEPSLEP